MAEQQPWLTKDIAARELGVSTKTIEAMVKAGKLRQRSQSRPGRPPLVVLHPDDVERERESRAGARMAAPAAGTTAAAVRPDFTPPADVQDFIRTMLEATLETIVPKLLPPPAAAAGVPIASKQLLTMEEAHRLGWPLDTLRELKQRENPPGVRYGRNGRGFRFSADALRRLSGGYSENS